MIWSCTYMQMLEGSNQFFFVKGTERRIYHFKSKEFFVLENNIFQYFILEFSCFCVSSDITGEYVSSLMTVSGHLGVNFSWAEGGGCCFLF